jgi:hypothetical protein
LDAGSFGGLDKNRSVVAVELRYLASMVAIAGMFALSIGIAIAIGVSAHLPDWATVSLAFALIAGSVLLAVTVWLREVAAKRRATPEPTMLGPESPQPQARYAPLVISGIVLVSYVVSIASRIQYMNATHWRIGLDSFVASTLGAIFFMYLALRSYVPKSNTKIDPAAQRTKDAIAAAYALPTREERRMALWPIWRRGYMRLGVILSEIPLFFILLPFVGKSFAMLGSIAIACGTFLLLHRRFGL